MRIHRLLPFLLVFGCVGDTSTTGLAGTRAPWTTATVPDDPAGPGETDPGDLETQLGCDGVFNPDQVLDFHIAVDPTDWQVLLDDLTFSVFVPATFACADEAPIEVLLRRKRSGGTTRVGLKVDFNDAVPGQRWKGLRRLTLENGVSDPGTEDTVETKSLVAEYLGWRVMQQGDLVAGRAVFANVHLNGALHGVFLNLEQVDKEFLQDRLGEDEGWLYKYSGGPNDGLKTHEDDGVINPHEAWFCFWGNGAGCEVPADFATEFPVRADLEQLLWLGAVNAYIANGDSPIFKDNNYYIYDSDFAPRLYIPWDLDTAMNDADFDVMTGRANGPDNGWDGELLLHWTPEYQALIEELLTRSDASFIQAELDRMVLAAGPSLDASPNAVGGSASAADDLAAWWVLRESAVRGQLGIP